MSVHNFYWIDSFTSSPFKGNPAAVCLCEALPDERWMQQLAYELNLSETAFVAPLGDSAYALRWFTPAAEVDLCGHATLASALALWAQNPTLDPKITFSTRSGDLKVNRIDGRARMNFPLNRTTDIEPPSTVHERFGASLKQCAITSRSGLPGLIVELESAAEVQGWRKDIPWVESLPYRSLILTAAATDSSHDFASRVFVPKLGVDEDPVTGSAHCALADYWSKRLDQQSLRAFQCSHRPGQLTLEVQNDRVLLIGEGQIILQGQITLPTP